MGAIKAMVPGLFDHSQVCAAIGQNISESNKENLSDPLTSL